MPTIAISSHPCIEYYNINIMQWLIVFALRFILPLTVFRRQLAGNVLAFFADSFDVVVFNFLGGGDYSRYDLFDKWLDLYWYGVAAFAALSWENRFAKNALYLLFGLRAAGTLLFTITSNRGLLLIFPDLFVWFLLFYLIYKRLFKRDLTPVAITLVLLLMLPLKLYQEYLLHFDVIDFYHAVWVYLFTPLGLERFTQ